MTDSVTALINAISSKISSLISTHDSDSSSHSDIRTAVDGKAASNHNHSGTYNKATYSQTLSSSTTGAYEIGKITVDGSVTTIYGKDTNTILSVTHENGYIKFS